jgi:hypothetical protein
MSTIRDERDAIRKTGGTGTQPCRILYQRNASLELFEGGDQLRDGYVIDQRET